MKEAKCEGCGCKILIPDYVVRLDTHNYCYRCWQKKGGDR